MCFKLKKRNLKIEETYDLSYEAVVSFLLCGDERLTGCDKFQSFILLSLMMLCFYLVLRVCENAAKSTAQQLVCQNFS